MAENTVGLYFEISADPTKATQALSQWRAASARETGAVQSHFTALQASAESARRSHEAAFGQMTNSVRSFGDASTRIFALVAEGILRNMQLEQLDAASQGRAEASKLSVSKQSMKEFAAVRAVQAFAKGLESLGDLNFWSAAQYFASSALYGGLAALQISSLLGAAGGGGSAGRTSGVASTAAAAPAGPVSLASGFAGSLQQPSGNVTVMVMGEPQAAQWLTKVINAGVLQHDLMLVASHTRRSAPAGR